jgi:hypothetical protein
MNERYLGYTEEKMKLRKYKETMCVHASVRVASYLFPFI